MTTTIKIRNASAHVKVLSWTEARPTENLLCPPNWDPVRGDHGPSLIQRHVTIAVGDTADVPADAWRNVLSTDSIVAAWIGAGELVEVAQST